MEKQSVFSFLKKNFFTPALLFLAGCTSAEPIHADSSGFFEQYFVYPFSLFIKGIAGLLNDNYGLAIILLTVTIRLALMPFFLRQTRSSLQIKEKYDALKPELTAIHNKYKNKQSQNAQLEMQRELMKVYQKHHINPLASAAGCLPIILQFPILIGFYYAILRTPEISAHSFLWFDLGSRDFILTVIAICVYFIQFKAAQIGMSVKVKQQMAIIGVISPAVIGIISLNSPAVLPLYWSVSGIFMIGQTIMLRRIHAAAEKNKQPV